MDKKLLDLLVCPVTKGPLIYDRARQELISRGARLAYPIRDGIPIMLEEEARELSEEESRPTRAGPVNFSVFVPARHAATRLPGKPLLSIAGKTLIEHVWARAVASGAQRVVVATDDARIAEVAQNFGAEVCLTRADHPSGSDRIAEAARVMGEPDEAIIVNLQGDEPRMPATVIRQVAEMLDAAPRAEMATVCERFASEADWRDPNQVKVLRDEHNRALIFSRAPVPHARDGEPWRPGPLYCRHVGLYAYRAVALQRLVRWPPHALEMVERLEQLRALAHGMTLLVEEAVEPCGVGIDTPDDLARFRREFSAAEVSAS